jgi:hypothetical protein
MRIEGTFGHEHQRLNKSDAKTGSGKKAGKTAGASAESILASSVSPSLLQAAFQASDINTDAVQAARAALDNGELDTPEAAKNAARAILDLGI